MTETKPFVISKRLVWDAYKCVKANRCGLDLPERQGIVWKGLEWVPPRELHRR
jgi:hypothetical protein